MPRRIANKSRDETRGETRQRLLEAGWELVREVPVGNVLSQVKAADVARRAGLTTGAFYYHFEDQDAFVEELLDHGLAPDRQSAVSDVRTAVDEAFARGAPLEELVRLGANVDFEAQTQRNAFFAVHLALWGKAKFEPDLEERLRRLYEGLNAEMVPVYEEILEANRLALRPPFTVEMLAVAFTALVEGLVLRWGVDPGAVPGELPPAQGADDDDGAGRRRRGRARSRRLRPR